MNLIERYPDLIKPEKNIFKRGINCNPLTKYIIRTVDPENMDEFIKYILKHHNEKISPEVFISTILFLEEKMLDILEDDSEMYMSLYNTVVALSDIYINIDREDFTEYSLEYFVKDDEVLIETYHSGYDIESLMEKISIILGKYLRNHLEEVRNYIKNQVTKSLDPYNYRSHVNYLIILVFDENNNIDSDVIDMLSEEILKESIFPSVSEFTKLVLKCKKIFGENLEEFYSKLFCSVIKNLDVDNFVKKQTQYELLRKIFENTDKKLDCAEKETISNKIITLRLALTDKTKQNFFKELSGILHRNI